MDAYFVYVCVCVFFLVGFMGVVVLVVWREVLSFFCCHYQLSIGTSS